jgi:hypothetical protein
MHQVDVMSDKNIHPKSPNQQALKYFKLLGTNFHAKTCRIFSIQVVSFTSNKRTQECTKFLMASINHAMNQSYFKS